jgi:hypothetical protein
VRLAPLALLSRVAAWHGTGRRGRAKLVFYERDETVMVSTVFAENENAADVSRYQLATMTEHIERHSRHHSA